MRLLHVGRQAPVPACTPWTPRSRPPLASIIGCMPSPSARRWAHVQLISVLPAAYKRPDEAESPFCSPSRPTVRPVHQGQSSGWEGFTPEQYGARRAAATAERRAASSNSNSRLLPHQPKQRLHPYINAGTDIRSQPSCGTLPALEVSGCPHDPNSH